MRNPPVKLLDRVRQRIRLKGYSIRTEKTYERFGVKSRPQTDQAKAHFSTKTQNIKGLQSIIK